jgi:hypothetical protein
LDLLVDVYGVAAHWTLDYEIANSSCQAGHFPFFEFVETLAANAQVVAWHQNDVAGIGQANQTMSSHLIGLDGWHSFEALLLFL